MARAPEWHALAPGTRDSLAESLGTIAEQLAPAVPPPPIRQPQPDQQQAPAPSAPADGSQQPPAGGGTTATGRVGEVTRATLNAIDFPSFVASLIQGTFKAIVDASIQQMEAYAELLKNVAKTVDQFMNDNVTDGQAKDYLADEHPDVFTKDTSSGTPTLTVNQNGDAPQQLPSFLQDLGFQAPQDIDNHVGRGRDRPGHAALARGAAPADARDDGADGDQPRRRRRRRDPREAHVPHRRDRDDGAEVRPDRRRRSGTWRRPEVAARSPRRRLMVNTTSLNAQSDINVRADLTGQVSVKFRSETFPLERFADSAAIQLINNNAKVPPPKPEPAAGTTPAATTTPPATAAAPAAPAPAPAAPAPAAPTAPAARPVAQEVDEWAPRSRG